MFELIKESLSDFHLASYLIDEVQIGSVDSVSKLWEDIFTTFPVDSWPIRFEYIARITVDDDSSQDEMMRGLVQQAVQQAFKTEVQKFDEELGNDYETNQHVYRAMVTQRNREEREDEEGY